jgi:anaerobic C4-dicarboxylate transporter DcuA
MWHPTDSFRMGLEYLYGHKETSTAPSATPTASTSWSATTWCVIPSFMDIKLILEFSLSSARSPWARGLAGSDSACGERSACSCWSSASGIVPEKLPGDVLLIVLTVIMAASAMEVAGGIDFLVRVAEKIIRKNPKQVTIVAPLVTYAFTFAAGTGHIVYPLLPVIYEVAHENGIRPERPMAVATIASQQAITASPVSAATAAMITILASHGVGLVQILLICVPSTLLAVIIAAFVQLRMGKELKGRSRVSAPAGVGRDRGAR